MAGEGQCGAEQDGRDSASDVGEDGADQRRRVEVVDGGERPADGGGERAVHVVLNNDPPHVHKPRKNGSVVFLNRLTADTKSNVKVCRDALTYARNAMLTKYGVHTNAQLHVQIAADWPCRTARGGGPQRAWEGKTPPQPYRVQVPSRFLMGTRRTPTNDEGSTVITTTTIWHGPAQDEQLITATLLLLYHINTTARRAMEDFIMLRFSGPRRSDSHRTASASIFTATPPLPPSPPSRPIR